MKILLDECLPRKLKQSFVEYDVATVQDMGWTGTKNGALLRLAENEFEVFITADRNLTYQQNLRSSILFIIVFVAPNNRLATLQALVPRVIRQLERVTPGEVAHVSASTP